MGKLGWQPRSAVMERREADAAGMGDGAELEPRSAGLLSRKLAVRTIF